MICRVLDKPCVCPECKKEIDGTLELFVHIQHGILGFVCPNCNKAIKAMRAPSYLIRLFKDSGIDTDGDIVCLAQRPRA